MIQCGGYGCAIFLIVLILLCHFTIDRQNACRPSSLGPTRPGKVQTEE
jgi:hypothetical protein